ncbi:hypothetical protein Zymop_0094 [Zymomonas mobilis subsp. pomaceae ATCC 29192]|uniref:Uncharacterized protein n=1 Tax=Zymomonas mobilis subsp. pomaceae (strain ATCC 29192 / DSM 22645 / JCM 10191 / CCUG 17912 / NBRC 13757 / NCIMB 11200 / NRRL B-4491 / Barker I) TaxID=579138 RepID=F8ETA8_ZYMMT|nr:hypothetical protein Zymop_0094 [Zymomonas mobilis subsp. pomaceae ATCC 29192]
MRSYDNIMPFITKGLGYLFRPISFGFFFLPFSVLATPLHHAPPVGIMEIHLNMHNMKDRPPRGLPPEGKMIPPPETIWKESKGPKCIAPEDVGAAAMSERDSVDLILRGGHRIRAHLEHCPALDFYSGFYVRAGQDGQICAKRDPVYARWGGECLIHRFRFVEGVLKH